MFKMNAKQIAELTEVQKVIKVEVKYHYRLELMGVKFTCDVPEECRKWVTRIVGDKNVSDSPITLHYIPVIEKQSLLLSLLFNESFSFSAPANQDPGNHSRIEWCLERFRMRMLMLHRKNAEHIVLKAEISEEEFLALRDFLDEKFIIEFI